MLFVYHRLQTSAPSHPASMPPCLPPQLLSDTWRSEKCPPRRPIRVQ